MQTRSAHVAEVELPQLGESVTEGIITAWLVEVGDEVAVDQPIVEISTDKVDTEIPSPVAGTVQELRAEVDDTIEVGQVIAVIGEGAPTSDDGTTAATTADDSGDADDGDTAADTAAEDAGAAAPRASPAPTRPRRRPRPADDASHRPADAPTRPSGYRRARATTST
jgi:pyruvate/2-oxoglutarate dehydrogenase complex dihydrolipoamide acyltransferase (E2) component